MATHMNSDRILTEADYIRLKEECEARQAKVDPRNVYTVSYIINGKKMTETITSFSTADAIAHVKQQCGMVGWIPYDIKIIDTKLAAEVG